MGSLFSGKSLMPMFINSKKKTGRVASSGFNYSVSAKSD
jgi:hypothetical protein